MLCQFDGKITLLPLTFHTENTVFPFYQNFEGAGCYEIAGGVGGLTVLSSRPFDACGYMVDDGYQSCPKCNIYLCLLFCLDLTKSRINFQPSVQCGGETLNSELALALFEIDKKSNANKNHRSYGCYD
jgi:hypothetical protein